MNKLVAKEGKVFKNKLTGEMLGAELYLGKNDSKTVLLTNNCECLCQFLFFVLKKLWHKNQSPFYDISKEIL